MKIVHIIMFLSVISSGLAYTDTEVVAATLILEAGGEKDPRGMPAVREVISNRATKRKMTEASVCLQKLQFSCWNGGNIQSKITKAKRHPKWDRALLLARSSQSNFTGGSDHYHTTSVSPSWSKRLRVRCIIGNHIFLM